MKSCVKSQKTNPIGDIKLKAVLYTSTRWKVYMMYLMILYCKIIMELKWTMMLFIYSNTRTAAVWATIPAPPPPTWLWRGSVRAPAPCCLSSWPSSSASCFSPLSSVCQPSRPPSGKSYTLLSGKSFIPPSGKSSIPPSGKSSILSPSSKSSISHSGKSSISPSGKSSIPPSGKSSILHNFESILIKLSLMTDMSTS